MAATGSDQYLKERLEIDARKCGLVTFRLVNEFVGTPLCSLWDSLMKEDELPVIASVGDESEWCLLTTRNVIWSFRSELHSVSYLSIKKCVVPELQKAIEGKKSSAIRDAKLHARIISLETGDGKEYQLNVPRGGAVLAINPLNKMINLSRIHAK